MVDDDYAWKVLERAIEYPHEDITDDYKTLDLSAEGAHDSSGKFIRLRRRHAYYQEDNRDFPMRERLAEKYPGEWRDKWDEGKWDTVSYPPEDVKEEENIG